MKKYIYTLVIALCAAMSVSHAQVVDAHGHAIDTYVVESKLPSPFTNCEDVPFFVINLVAVTVPEKDEAVAEISREVNVAAPIPVIFPLCVLVPSPSVCPNCK